MELYLSLISIFVVIGTGLALECYVCQDQPDNKDKCIKTSVQCRENEDTCLTHIEWKAPTFWTPRSEKIHYLHKSCNESSYCARKQREIGLECMRDWYRDWQCVECCQGDRCNFYVTLGASSLFASLSTVLVSLAAVLMLLRWR